MLKIGIYGGTFDPVHHGHLILSRQACEEHGFDQLIFVPAALSPFKKTQAQATGELRLEMLRAAIQRQNDFIADDCELKRRPPSYSIDTVLQIRERNPNAELFWLILGWVLRGWSWAPCSSVMELPALQPFRSGLPRMANLTSPLKPRASSGFSCWAASAPTACR